MLFLGKGTLGCAFYNGTDVIKITLDKTEAKASNKIKGIDLKHVVKIFDVVRFDEMEVYFGR